MTTGQKEAIKSLDEFANTKYGALTASEGREILNLVQEQEKEIEHWKNGFERELESNRENACELLKQDLIIRKKDKIIDLMAKAFKQDDVRSVEEIKQYFERKVEDENR